MRTRSFVFLVGLMAVIALVSAVPARGQDGGALPDPGWQVMKADWGVGNRWADVTPQVRILLSGNGMVKVNNQNLGGDPAVGADKILRIKCGTTRANRAFSRLKKVA